MPALDSFHEGGGKHRRNALKATLCLAGVALASCTTSRYTTAAGGEVLVNPNGVMVTNNAAALKQGMRKLWSDHVVWTRAYIVAAVADDLVAAAKASDNAKLTDADRRWKANAADIAAFLSGANPNWSRDVLLTMLSDHLRLTTENTFDKIFEQAMMMADALADGIIKQFPNKV